MRTRRISPRLVQAVMALLSTGLALAATEIALRVLDWPSADPVWVVDPATGFRFAGNLSYRHIQPEYDVAFATNSRGQRDDEPSTLRPRRAILLGDSFTCGYGVERSQMFADLLERELDCELTNAATGGFETIHQLRWLEEHETSGELIVYVLYLGNDVCGNLAWQRDEQAGLVRRDGRPALHPPRELKLASLAKRSVWGRRAWHACRATVRRGPERSEWRPDRGYLGLAAVTEGDEARADWAETGRLLAALRDLARDRGCRLAVVTMPTRVDVEQDARQRWAAAQDRPDDAAAVDFALPTLRAAKLLDELRIEHFSLLDPLRADHVRLGQPLYYAHDGHLTPLGNACVAERLGPWLADQIARGAQPAN